MYEPEKDPPQSIDEAGDEFVRKLKKHHSQDPHEVSEDSEAADAA